MSLLLITFCSGEVRAARDFGRCWGEVVKPLLWRAARDQERERGRGEGCKNWLWNPALLTSLGTSLVSGRPCSFQGSSQQIQTLSQCSVHRLPIRCPLYTAPGCLSPPTPALSPSHPCRTPGPSPYTPWAPSSPRLCCQYTLLPPLPTRTLSPQ